MLRAICLMFLLFSIPGNREPRCLVHLETPEYPNLAWDARIEGQVTVSIHIAPSGKVTSALGRSGHRLLRVEAEGNVSHWIFAPGLEEDAEITYRFKLQKPEARRQSTPHVEFDLPYSVLILSNLPQLNQ